MKLIADCGGTKCDWAMSSSKGQWSFLTISGYNAVTDSIDKLSKAIELPINQDEVTDIMFNLAGYQTSQNQKIKDALAHEYKNAVCTIQSDLEACQLIVESKGGGLCFILGTGSSLSIVGQKNKISIPSMGFLLGDEGGGLDIIKTILVNYYRQQFSQNLMAQIAKIWDVTYADFVILFYGNNTKFWLQKASQLLRPIFTHAEVRSLVKDRLNVFFDLIPKDDYPMNAFGFGSISNAYKDDIRSILIESKGCKDVSFIQAPIKVLVELDHST